MLRVTVAVVLVSLVACSDMSPMTRQQVIAAVNECTDAGFDARVMQNGWTFEIYRVDCIPKKKETNGTQDGNKEDAVPPTQ